MVYAQEVENDRVAQKHLHRYSFAPAAVGHEVSKTQTREGICPAKAKTLLAHQPCLREMGGCNRRRTRWLRRDKTAPQPHGGVSRHRQPTTSPPGLRAAAARAGKGSSSSEARTTDLHSIDAAHRV